MPLALDSLRYILSFSDDLNVRSVSKAFQSVYDTHVLHNRYYAIVSYEHYVSLRKELPKLSIYIEAYVEYIESHPSRHDVYKTLVSISVVPSWLSEKRIDTLSEEFQGVKRFFVDPKRKWITLCVIDNCPFECHDRIYLYQDSRKRYFNNTSSHRHVLIEDLLYKKTIDLFLLVKQIYLKFRVYKYSVSSENCCTRIEEILLPVEISWERFICDKHVQNSIYTTITKKTILSDKKYVRVYMEYVPGRDDMCISIPISSVVVVKSTNKIKTKDYYNAVFHVPMNIISWSYREPTVLDSISEYRTFDHEQ